MATRSRLVATRVPKSPDGVVLVLHGGASRDGDTAVSPTQLSVLRMIPIASRIARSGRRRLAVFRLLNSSRGWDTSRTPVDDVTWALGEVRQRFGTDLPVALVGHSLGGRAALLAAVNPEVRSVVALNPWVYPADGGTPMRDRRILIVHGTADHIANPESSAAVARGLARHSEVGYVRVIGGKHAMLRRHSVFDRLAADFVAATLLDRAVNGVVGGVLRGESPVDI
ncbi:alpha/beta fold hydrolase [Aeromicrobium sp.]|uniref:alpha/beta hydrolase n=1 Tax=Aeromicrobium sp. TaxID=1871063 RepID=UPI00199447C4|nr:alpha/beta fold hydrolase [Aeromicrobium sp.]MBC7632427.1 alpha/beta fold hydrolase [Aeromicrobium sp.]